MNFNEITHEDEDKIYEFFNDQYQLELQRTRDIENKAVNIILFSGIILGLEFNFLSNFYSYTLVSGNLIYYLVALTSSFFITTIILCISALIISRNHIIEDLILIIKQPKEDFGKILPDITSKLSMNIEKNNGKNEIKYRFLKSSQWIFLIGIVFVTLLFGIMFRLILYS